MLKSFSHGPIISAIRKTALLWLYYARIPVIIGLCLLLRSSLFPSMPAAISVLLVNVILLFATYHIYRIWRVRALLFPKEDLPCVQPLFALIPMQLVFVGVSTVIVFL